MTRRHIRSVIDQTHCVMTRIVIGSGRWVTVPTAGGQSGRMNGGGMSVETGIDASEAEGDREGYRRDEGAGWRHRTALRRPQFPKTPWGHRGYDETTVDAFARDAVIKVTAA